MGITTFTVCTIQPVIYWQEPARTFDSIASLLAQAAAAAPLDVAVLPEHFNATPAPDGDHTHWQAAQDFAAALARRHRINLVAGSVERWDTAEQARVNTTVIYDRDGCELGRYDKRRLFGFEKRRNVRAGSDALVLEVEGTRLGVPDDDSTRVGARLCAHAVAHASHDPCAGERAGCGGQRPSRHITGPFPLRRRQFHHRSRRRAGPE